MRIDAVALPEELRPELLRGRTAVVFDVLRATTTIVTALANGACAVRVFADHASLLEAGRTHAPPRLLAGETRCLRPDGFDLGNSPREYTRERVKGATVLLSTSNGTKAIHASSAARRVLCGAVVNADAIARALADDGGDVVLVCAGTNGEPADEDRCGCGAAADRLLLIRPDAILGFEATACLAVFREQQTDLAAFFQTVAGGRNLIAAGLREDLPVAAAIDRLDVVPEVKFIGADAFVRPERHET